MSEFRRIMMSSFLMLLLHFPANGEYSFLTVRVGDEVTLPCDNVIDDQDKCDSTTWLFYYAPNTPAVTLFEGGQIHNDAKGKSDRLRVTENCSLVIKKVTEEDAGLYFCRQFRSGRQGSDSLVYLSVVTMTEHQDTDEVTLRCSVLSNGWCIHTVEWLYGDQNVVKDNRDIQTSDCSAAVTFSSSLKEKPIYRGLFKCQVMNTNYEGKKQLFTFSPPQPPGNDEMTTTSEQDGKHPGWWCRIIVVTVGVAALTIITVAVIRRKRTQGNETQTDDNVADPEDGASYASISYTRKSSRKARAHDDDDEDGEVTYTVRAPSSSSAASTDPSLLFATINKPKK
ncbi:uncharacterized protein LOC117487636 isoform X2 [Trematomus bernacchii]|uniref:uncharacterized protein LOC117487636 isoform X2 n=1 Tax=Trematomus bernacchii TaxID=40690 RepID=UPI00146E04BC|nr:uncharacterized protein LOC117487636 isoform X2 [Trematomus bernacchii]